MYNSFGISLSSQSSLALRNKKFFQLQVTTLRILSELKYSTQSAARRCVNRPYLAQPENVFIERGDRFKLLHNANVWFGVNSLGPLVEIDNINEIIKKQTEIDKKNLRKIDEIKETKINDLHIPKYVRIKLKANKQFKPTKGKRNLKKIFSRAKPENELRLQRKKVHELAGEYYWPEKYYDMNLQEDIKELRQEFRRKLKKSKPLTIEKILHPHKQSTHVLKQNTKLIPDVLSIDRDSQNSILNKIFYNTNDEQLKSNKSIDFKRSSLFFTNKEFGLNNPEIKTNYLDNSALSQSAAQKIRAMINPYGTDSIRRLRIFNNNHYTYIYDKHLFDDIVETPPKNALFASKMPEKRLQISDANAMKKERILQYIKNNHNYLNMPTKSIHIQVNLPVISSNIGVERTAGDIRSNEWNLNNVLNTFKTFVSKILIKKQTYMEKLIKKNKKYIDRIRSYLGLRRSRYIDSFPKLTNSDLSILERKKKHNQISVCYLDNHPTHIINSRNDYFTQPSLDELVPYVDDTNQTCIVENFTIGRIGYGTIEFLEPVDVYNLNIDRDLQFTRKNIDIYPNDFNKPPIGVGLNKKAKITLYEVWPTDKYTNATITDENQLESLQFKTMLEAICAERNFKFVSYCGRSGCWVFHVDHF